MIADFAIHQPDKEDGGIPNPHFHILCPIRPIEPDGKWGCKQRRRYRLDEDGNRIIGEDGKPLFDAVPTTDWGDPATLEEWRRVWAEMVNAKFEEKGLTCRVDHRSYERQGFDLLPTVHEGVAVRQMEAKGIATDKGEFNRWIKKARDLLRGLRKKITDLTDWIKAAKTELSKLQAPTLATLLSGYYIMGFCGAPTPRALKRGLAILRFLLFLFAPSPVGALAGLVLQGRQAVRQQFPKFMQMMRGRDPQKMLNELVSSGKVNQAQLDAAQKQAQQLGGMFSQFKGMFGR